MKSHNIKNLERYVSIVYDETPCAGVYPANIYHIPPIGENYPGETPLIKLMRVVGGNYFNTTNFNLVSLKELCFIKVRISISIIDKIGWEKDPIFKEYSKYKEDFLQNKPSYPTVWWERNNVLYSLDGMHRIMSALEAKVSSLEAIILIKRTDLYKYVDSSKIQSINNEGAKCTWFPRYQEIREVNLNGQRKQVPRYTQIYDFRFLKDKKVVDLGCNIGQATIEAFFNGSKEIYGFDYQSEAIQTARAIADALHIENIKYDTVDFNNWPTMDKVKNLGSCDWMIFQAIYRTREIKDINPVMDFIYDFTKEGIIFEGHADPNIDTFEFYDKNVFKKYNYKYQYLGKSENRPAWLLTK
ncbi:hypothetical protein LCGC14_1890750 [marine sediment metagenome]|uniref:Methyltransferase domain-containing protein n=1 Tax=marine sediment metagenome TaxID=412755 RepID=A0A0F9FZT9_9ZZZZ